MGQTIITFLKIFINPFNLGVIIIGLLSSYYIWKKANYKYYRGRILNRQLLNYLPNIWTSLGILGTFSAIVYAFKWSDVDWTDVNELVKTIVPAFETSIIGIVGAIIASVLSKKKYAEEDNKAEVSYLTTYKLMPEQHIGSIDIQMARLLKITQNNHAELLAESKAQRSLAEKMITEFTDNLRDFYDNLFNEEEQHAQEMVERYLNGINQLIMGTHATIRDKFEQLFTEHAEALKTLMTNEENKFKELSDNVTTTLNQNSTEVINSISNIGMNEIETLETIIQTQEEQLQTIVDSNKVELTKLTTDASEKLKKTTDDFTKLLETLQSQFEKLASDLPNDLQTIKESLIATIQQLTNEKFATLTASNQTFVNGLLGQVEKLEEQITNNANKNQEAWSTAVNTLLLRMLNQVDTDVKAHVASMQKASKDIGDDLSSIINTLNLATTNYSTTNQQITALVDALKKETNATEVYASSITSTSTQLSEIQKLLREIANKNLQLRQELSQWRRTHKHVKVDTEKGTKECPECKAENPIDASYCRRCATSFWQCEPIPGNK